MCCIVFVVAANVRRHRLEQALNYREREPGCLSGTGMREPDYVTAGQRNWNRLGLNGSGMLIPRIAHGIE
jgi:hypothetical protein